MATQHVVGSRMSLKEEKQQVFRFVSPHSPKIPNSNPLLSSTRRTTFWCGLSQNGPATTRVAALVDAACVLSRPLPEALLLRLGLVGFDCAQARTPFTKATASSTCTRLLTTTHRHGSTLVQAATYSVCSQQRMGTIAHFNAHASNNMQAFVDNIARVQLHTSLPVQAACTRYNNTWRTSMDLNPHGTRRCSERMHADATVLVGFKVSSA